MSVFRFIRLSVFLPIGIEYNATKISLFLISYYLAKCILDQRTLETVPTIMA